MSINSHLERRINKDVVEEIRFKVKPDLVEAQAVPIYFRLENLLCVRKGVAARATRIWVAQEVKSNRSTREDANGLTVKDYWRETDTTYSEF